MCIAVCRSHNRKKPDSAIDNSLQTITEYLGTKQPEMPDMICSKCIASELEKITNEDIKRRIKRKVTDVVFDGVEEDVAGTSPSDDG